MSGDLLNVLQAQTNMMILVSGVLENKKYCFLYLLKKPPLSKDLKEVRDRAMDNSGGNNKCGGPEAGMCYGKNQETSMAGAEGGGQRGRG